MKELSYEEIKELVEEKNYCIKIDIMENNGRISNVIIGNFWDGYVWYYDNYFNDSGDELELFSCLDDIEELKELIEDGSIVNYEIIKDKDYLENIIYDDMKEIEKYVYDRVEIVRV